MSNVSRRRGPIPVYKHRHAGTPRKAPRCLACYPASVAGAVVPLGRGMQLVLCAEHRDPEWLGRRSGRDFLSLVSTTLTSFGRSSRRFDDAVEQFLRQILARHTPPPRRRPGSYAWPGWRQAAELVWARGGTYEAGERLVQARAAAAANDETRGPSVWTIRRWYRERRWIIPSPQPRSATRTLPPTLDRTGERSATLDAGRTIAQVVPAGSSARTRPRTAPALALDGGPVPDPASPRSRGAGSATTAPACAFDDDV